MSQYWEQWVESAEDMIALGGRLAANLNSIQRIYFSGDLGVGKTVLIRGILQGLGHQGPVKSPTFSLLEPYTDKIRPVFHFDFYRIENPEEIEFLGWREYFIPDNLCLVEWPSKAIGILPLPCLNVIIRKSGESRMVRFEAVTLEANAVLEELI